MIFNKKYCKCKEMTGHSFKLDGFKTGNFKATFTCLKCGKLKKMN